MEKPRRTILVIGPVPPRLTGGIASYVGFMLASPALSGRFRLVALDNSLAPLWRRNLVTRLAASLGLTLRLSVRLARLRPDAVHIHSSSFSSFWEKTFLLTVCRLFGRFTILHLHGASFKEFYQNSPLKRAIRYFLDRADVLVALSPYWRGYLGSLSRSRIEIVPNCAAEAFFGVRADVAANSAVVFTGEIGRRKGADVLIEAFGLLRGRGVEAPLLVAGDCALGDSLEAWKERARRAGVEGIQFLGTVDQAGLVGLFSRAALFTLPSCAEGVPIAMLEAMAAGLPVVVTPVGGIPDAVQDGEQGLIVPVGDSRVLADRIESLLAAPELRRRMGESARRTAEMKYAPAVTARALLALYDSLPG
ncbi:glycosyltransferase family 4 protein [bacterium]|nr:glycosyltransferase family 4 protein [bacterium]